MATLATTSTVPAVKERLFDLIRWQADQSGDTGVQVAYIWPGRETIQEVIYLGRPPFDGTWESSDGNSEIATVKAGRQQRQETYQLYVTCWSFAPSAAVEHAAQVEARGHELSAHVENVLADYPRLIDVTGLPSLPGTFDVALNPGIEIAQQTSRLGPYSDGGILSAVELTLSVRARLA